MNFWYIDEYEKLTWKFDQKGRVIEKAYLNDTDLSSIYTTIEETYSMDGSILFIDFAYRKETRKITNPPKILIEYDENDNPCKYEYRKENGNCLYHNGYVKAILKYNIKGYLIEEAYYDCFETPCFNKEGYSKIKLKYNNQGDWIEKSYFDTSGNPVYVNGYLLLKREIKYDKYGIILKDNIRSFRPLVYNSSELTPTRWLKYFLWSNFGKWGDVLLHILFRIICGIICGFIYKHKNRNFWMGFLWGGILTFIGFIIVLLTKRLGKKEKVLK